jgi:hypothetical protein
VCGRAVAEKNGRKESGEVGFGLVGGPRGDLSNLIEGLDGVTQRGLSAADLRISGMISDGARGVLRRRGRESKERERGRKGK